MKLLNKKLKNNIKMFYYKNTNVNQNIKTQIKKAFDIIYQYHVREKKIIFINVPILIIKNIKKKIKKSKHIFIPPNIWINGLITNQSTCLYSILKKKKKKQKNIKLLLNFKKKSDLIVNLDNENLKISNIIKESCNAKIPIISFDKTKNDILFKPTYLLKNASNYVDKFFFYSILLSILKKKSNIKKNSYIFEKDFYTKKKIYKKKYTKKFFNKKNNYKKNNYKKNNYKKNSYNKNNYNKNNYNKNNYNKNNFFLNKNSNI